MMSAGDLMPAVPPRPYHFITVVWGVEYLDVFLNISLATQLAPGNLEAFKDRRGCRYRIFTRRHEFDYVKIHPLVGQLASLMDVDFVPIDDFFSDEVMQHGDWFIRVMSAGHRRSIVDARHDNAAMFFIPPDSLFSSGSFENVARMLSHRDGAVLVNAPRLDQNRTSETVNTYRSPDGTLSFSSRTLVRLAIDHLQRSTESLFWDSKNFNLNPTAVYWRTRNGFLANCFHLHPLLVIPAEWNAEFGDSIDGQYIGRACPEPTSVQVVRDSDAVAMFTVTPAERLIGCATRNRATIGRIAYFYARTARPEHQRLFSVPIRHHADGSSAGWIPAELRALALVRLLSIGWLCGGLASWHERTARKRQRRRRLVLKYRQFNPEGEPLWKVVATVWMDSTSRRADKIRRRVRKRGVKTYKRLGHFVRESRAQTNRRTHRWRKTMLKALRERRATLKVPLRRLSKTGRRHVRRVQKRYEGVMRRRRMFLHRARKLVTIGITRVPPFNAVAKWYLSRNRSAP